MPYFCKKEPGLLNTVDDDYATTHKIILKKEFFWGHVLARFYHNKKMSKKIPDLIWWNYCLHGAKYLFVLMAI